MASIARPRNTVESAIQRAILRGDVEELKLLMGEMSEIGLTQSDLALATRARSAMEKLGSADARMLAGRYGVDFANKIGHVFAKAEHNLQALVQRFGSAERAFVEIQTKVDALALPAGQFQTTVTVSGVNITVRGFVQDGLAQIGTAFGL